MSEIKDRLKEIMTEVGVRSVTQFAKEVGVSQKAMDNYVKGLNKPGMIAINSIVSRYPEYNMEWLSNGRGEKYNSTYVGNSVPTQWGADNNANVNGNNSSNVTQTFTSSNNNDALVEELKKSRERLIKRMARRLQWTIDRCKTTDEMTRELEGLLIDLDAEKE